MLLNRFCRLIYRQSRKNKNKSTLLLGYDTPHYLFESPHVDSAHLPTFGFLHLSPLLPRRKPKITCTRNYCHEALYEDNFHFMKK